MKFVLAVLFLVAATVAGSVGYLAARPPDSPTHARLEQEADRLLELVPSEGAREALRVRAARLAQAGQDFAERHPAGRRVTLGPALRATAVRSALALAAAPTAIALLLIGTLAGLLRRDVLRDEFGFASLTFSYAGKAAVALSVALYAVTGLSPLGPPVWSLYLWSISAAMGAALYFGNLPPKL